MTPPPFKITGPKPVDYDKILDGFTAEMAKVGEEIMSEPVGATTPGIKFDDDKLRVDLMPVDAMESIAAVLTFGAKKYNDRNWEKGMNWSRLYRAAVNHLWQWWKGKDLDDETGLPHLAHAATCVIFLLSYHLRHTAKDQRNKFDNRPL